MGGLFGVVCKEDCVMDLFYGTDYHSHMGTCRGGLAVRDNGRIHRSIHDITNAQFRTKFDHDIRDMHGSIGLGVISDFDSQPLIIGSHLGTYAIVTVGRINNVNELAQEAFDKRVTHFAEIMSGGGVNPTELVATLINHEASLEDGLERALSLIDGSLSIVLMTDHGLYAARDRYGRTPLIVGRKEGGCAVTMETAAFPNLGYEVERYLGPGEVVRITADGVEQLKKPGETLQICAFLWVYFGFPASGYEGVNVEQARSRCGAALARRDDVEVDVVAGIPDSGVGHAIGYANESKTMYGRPFAKYTPTWPRSFMPQDQRQRDLVARMKLIPIKDLIRGQRILFCDDSIVRGTQLKDTIQRLYECGATEIHMRAACPPLVFGCKFLNFSRSKSEMDLAARHAMKELGSCGDADARAYATYGTPEYHAMVDCIRKRLNLKTLRYQLIGDLVDAIGLPKEKLCTYCWDGCDGRRTCDKAADKQA